MTHDETLLLINSVLSDIDEYAGADLFQARTIQRQLRWCRGLLRGEPVEDPPGPLTMGLIATREFDMWGDQPELASSINTIERYMNEHFAARIPSRSKSAGKRRSDLS